MIAQLNSGLANRVGRIGLVGLLVATGIGCFAVGPIKIIPACREACPEEMIRNDIEAGLRAAGVKRKQIENYMASLGHTSYDFGLSDLLTSPVSPLHLEPISFHWEKDYFWEECTPGVISHTGAFVQDVRISCIHPVCEEQPAIERPWPSVQVAMGATVPDSIDLPEGLPAGFYEAKVEYDQEEGSVPECGVDRPEANNSVAIQFPVNCQCAPLFPTTTDIEGHRYYDLTVQYLEVSAALQAGWSVEYAWEECASAPETGTMEEWIRIYNLGDSTRELVERFEGARSIAMGAASGGALDLSELGLATGSYELELIVNPTGSLSECGGTAPNSRSILFEVE